MFVFVFVFGFGFGTQLFMVEQTPIVYQAQTQTLGYDTGFEHKNLRLCQATQTLFVFSERTHCLSRRTCISPWCRTLGLSQEFLGAY